MSNAVPEEQLPTITWADHEAHRLDDPDQAVEIFEEIRRVADEVGSGQIMQINRSESESLIVAVDVPGGAGVMLSVEDSEGSWATGTPVSQSSATFDPRDWMLPEDAFLAMSKEERAQHQQRKEAAIEAASGGSGEVQCDFQGEAEHLPEEWFVQTDHAADAIREYVQTGRRPAAVDLHRE